MHRLFQRLRARCKALAAGRTLAQDRNWMQKVEEQQRQDFLRKQLEDNAEVNAVYGRKRADTDVTAEDESSANARGKKQREESRATNLKSALRKKGV